MYHTWFFLKRFAVALNEELSGLAVLECFSQQKDEVIIALGNEERELFLRADFSADAGLISLRNSFARARKNSVNLFSELLDAKVTRVEVFKHERSFQMNLDNGFDLIFKMHGSKSNLLISKHDKVTSIFRNAMKHDLEITPSSLNIALEINKPNILLLVGRKNHYLINNQLDEPIQLIELFNKNDINIGLNDSKPYLNLVDSGNTMLRTQNPIEAANAYADLFYRHHHLNIEKKRITQLLSKQIKQCKNYISKTESKLIEVRDQRNPEEIANLIMANLHALKPNKKLVSVSDIYQDPPQDISIKMNPNISPQKNAENYYRKSKNKKIEIEKLTANVNAKKRKLQELSNKLGQLQSLSAIKEIQQFEGGKKSKKSKEERAPLPYLEFDIEGYKVLVGKNAKTNDVLTLKVAKKNDLWLHARDVSGSHVVIRERPGSAYPVSVIEKAASLAAWYSKRKSDTLAPVIFTPKKFVRKVKGALPGQVMVDKEEVVIVEPTNQI